MEKKKINYIKPEGLNTSKEKLSYIKTIFSIPEDSCFDEILREILEDQMCECVGGEIAMNARATDEHNRMLDKLFSKDYQ